MASRIFFFCIFLPQKNVLTPYQVLSNIVLYGILAPYTNEQADLMHHIKAEPQLVKLPLFKYFFFVLLKKPDIF